MQKILSTDSLSKKYGSVQALQDLTIDVHQGDVYGILGPNGSGKTTTLGIVLGATNASSGTYTWFEEEGSYYELRKRVGAFLDRPSFYPNLNAIQNLRLVAEIKDLQQPGIDEAMELCGVRQYAKRKFLSYSTGMKQRLAIAATLLGDPEVLVLDEPTNGLDPKGIADVRELIKRIAGKGITVIMASHLLDEVQKVCSHVAVLKGGKKLYEGQVQTLVAGSGGIEISADDPGKLQKVLTGFDGVDKIEVKGEKVLVVLKAGFKSAELSGHLIKHGVDITHFAHRKGNLEEEFLHLLSENAR
jgi:ABC-2 type transport system ATP-binding protein